MGTPRACRHASEGGRLTVATIPSQLAGEQIAALRGKARASLLLAVADIRRRGCAAAGVRLAGKGLSSVCRLDLYAAWRLLTVFETTDRCVLLLVAQHTRTENPYQALYRILGISEPEEPRTKPTCCDPEGQPPIDPAIIIRFDQGARNLTRGLSSPRTARRKQH